MSIKTCSRCGVSKPVSEYHSNGKTRLRGSCKDCEKNRDAARKGPIKSTVKPACDSAATLKRLALEFSKWETLQNPFEDTYLVCEDTGCWLSTLGQLRCGRPMYGAQIHYRAVMKHFGHELDGMHVHHKCQNGLCVNPSHLQVVTPEEHREIHRVLDYPHLISVPTPKGWTQKLLTCRAAAADLLYSGKTPCVVLTELMACGHSTYLAERVLSTL